MAFNWDLIQSRIYPEKMLGSAFPSVVQADAPLTKPTIDNGKITGGRINLHVQNVTYGGVNSQCGDLFVSVDISCPSGVVLIAMPLYPSITGVPAYSNYESFVYYPLIKKNDTLTWKQNIASSRMTANYVSLNTVAKGELTDSEPYILDGQYIYYKSAYNYRNNYTGEDSEYIKNIIDNINNINEYNICYTSGNIGLAKLLRVKYTSPTTIPSGVPKAYDPKSVLGNTTTAGTYGTRIVSSIPIYPLAHIADAIDALETGDYSKAANQDDLKYSAVDLSTEWDVYINGGRFPEIVIRAKSDKLEEFLSDPTLNTAGWGRGDVRIEWRSPQYGNNLFLSDFDKLSPATPTSYGNISQIRYGEDITGGYMSFYQNNDYIPTYDQGNFVVINTSDPSNCGLPFVLDLRLNLKNDIYSSWVRIYVYYIGDKSAADFKEPYYEVVGISDGSFAKFIFDESPSEEDVYRDPEEESDIGEDSLPEGNSSFGLNKLTTSYEINDDNLNRLASFLWRNSLFDNLKNLNNSPIENIVSVKIMPLELSGVYEDITIGNVDTDINGKRITDVPVLDVGSLKYDGYYKNFLDYAPYTSVSIFLPFVGFINLNPAEITGHTLDVKYSFDIVTGMCKAMLFVDDIYFLSADGVCGVDVPLVATNRSQIEAGFINSTISNVLQLDPMGLVGTAVSSAIAMQHSHRNGGYSPTLGWTETRQVYLVIDMPVVNVPSSYAHDYGRPCNLTLNLSGLSGFTQTAADIDLSGICATEAELDEIRGLLSSGIYL